MRHRHLRASESSRAASGGTPREDRGLVSELPSSDIDALPPIFGHSPLRMEDLELELMIGIQRPGLKARTQGESVIRRRRSSY